MSDIKPNDSKIIHKDPWEKLRQFTNARIGLGRVGTSLPTSELLRFQLSHAQAIDAVHVPLDVDKLCEQFAESEILKPYLPIQKLHSKARDRMEYLQRPDLGRQLDEKSISSLQPTSGERYDLVFVLADGLSSYAISHHAKNFVELFIRRLNEESNKKLNIAPICVVQQGRVAVGDDVCEALNAKQVVLLIGERPGLSSPDSMGMYLTWNAKRGIEDSLRNCISNIRPEGLKYQAAVHKGHYLLTESLRLELTGVNLKDRSEDSLLDNTEQQHFCLTSDNNDLLFNH
ncbi:ethanolamine ammonia-lyase subunit EutC [Vibrio sp. 1-Bac 57]